MDIKPEHIVTENGSSTFYLPELQEHYHSKFGAVQESCLVFIKHGFHEVKRECFNILEVGFGTGLNALLTFLENNDRYEIFYHGIDLYPLDKKIISKLNYPEVLGCSDQLFKKIHEAKWNAKTRISGKTVLFKEKADFTGLSLENRYHLVYFDAFAPEVQPEMWDHDIFKKIHHAMADHSILTTYCAKGKVKRTLVKTGFIIEKLPGPPGKREIIRARKIK